MADKKNPSGKTDDQIAQELYDSALARCYRTTPANRPEAEAALHALHKVAGELDDVAKLPVVWELCPPSAGQTAYWLSAECDRHWITFYSGAPLIGVDDPESRVIVEALERMIDSCHLVAWQTDRIVLVEYPEIFLVDDQGRPHAVGGPDLRYRDPKGMGTYHWHGIRMPRKVMEHPEKITLADLRKESNQDRLRAMIALWPGGEARYLSESGAKPIDISEFGELYRLANDELICIVSDGITQLDGSNPRYTLRINRECRPMMKNHDGTITYGEPQKPTARNAVAASYGKKGADYYPSVRT